MKKTLFLNLLLLSLLLFKPIAAQFFPYGKTKFVHLLPGNNMSENSITCFLQDKQGFMWIGTKCGLFQYDGYDFKLFSMEPKDSNSLNNNYVRCLVESPNNELILIGTDGGGLNIYDKKTGIFSHFLHQQDDSTTIGSNRIFDILKDEDGKIWVATVNGGLNQFDFDRKIFKRHYINDKNPSSDSNFHIKCLFSDKTNRIWIGTRNSGLFLFDSKKATFLALSEMCEDKVNLQPNNIWSISQDRIGHLWIGTELNGISLLMKDKHNNYRTKKLGKKNGLGDYPILKIFCDSQGNIWIGSWANGLLKYNQDTNRFIQYINDENNPLSLSSNHVLAIFEDNAGSLWFGTHAGGINLIQPNKWKFNSFQFDKVKKNSVHINEVRSIYYQEHLNTLWLGTIRGLIKLNTKNGNRINYVHMPGNEQSLIHNAVNDISPGKESNSIWIGTPLGLTYMNTKENNFIHYRSSVMDSSAPYNINITKILKDKQGFLWIGTAHLGLVRFDPVEEDFITFKNSNLESLNLSPWPIRTIFQNSNEKLYLGTTKGIDIFDKATETFTTFSNDSKFTNILNTGILAIYQDENNIYWIGTSGYGLIKYNALSGKYKYFTKKDGLASNYICGILEDKNGFFYLSTDNGISQFDSYIEEFINYELGDGLHGTEFQDDAYYKSKDGSMFFGGINGFTSFTPDNILKNEFIPPVKITHFDVLNFQYQPDQNICYTPSVQLNYKMNSFSIEFVALNYINSLENEYLYKLAGVDQSWQKADIIREVTYRNVKPGSYTFRVIGSNNDGIWNEQGDTLYIYIKPPFWHTLTFKIFVIFLIITLIFYIIKRRFVLLKKEAQIRRRFTHILIKNQESERKRIAAELHDSLGQDLLVIKNQTSLVLKKEKNQRQKLKNLEQVCSVADEAIENIRQISYNLHPYQLEKFGLTEALKSMIQKVEDASHIKFDSEINKIDELLPKEQEINCYRILQEILNNIFKHSKASKSWIRINHFKKIININIKDNGKGFDYEKEIAEKRGFGLSDIRERVEILKGKLEIKSAQNKGTNFVVQIPVH